MDSAKYVTQHKRINVKNKKCAIQYTVCLINNNISRDVQEECANRCTEYIHIAASLHRVRDVTSNREPVEYRFKRMTIQIG